MRNRKRPLVSTIIIFHNEERFLAEAIASARSQTMEDWELVLVDDGSTDGSAAIARTAAAEEPGRIRCLTHPGGANLGMSASRNLGLTVSRGRFVAFLDGDDVWRPGKLDRQTTLARAHPEAAMITAPLLRWHRWTGDPGAADQEDLMGVGRRKFGKHPYAGRLVEPPTLVRLILGDDYFIPGGALIKRGALLAVGGFDPAFRTLYEDAVVMVKLAAQYPVFVDDEVHYLYRMHSDSSTNTESSSTTIDRKRAAYLETVDWYLRSNRLMTPSLKRAMSRARRSSHRDRHRRTRLLNTGRAIGRAALPRPVRDALRRRWFHLTRPEVLS